MRYALTLLAQGGVVAVFPQATISAELHHARGAVGLPALRSGAPGVPMAIRGTGWVHSGRPFAGRARVSIGFGKPESLTRVPAGGRRTRSAPAEVISCVAATWS